MPFACTFFYFFNLNFFFNENYLFTKHLISHNSVFETKFFKTRPWAKSCLRAWLAITMENTRQRLAAIKTKLVDNRPPRIHRSRYLACNSEGLTIGYDLLSRLLLKKFKLRSKNSVGFVQDAINACLKDIMYNIRNREKKNSH